MFTMEKITFNDLNLTSRIPSRPPNLRQPDYDLLFDYHTFAYDYFIKNNTLFIIGPCLPTQLFNELCDNIIINDENLKDKVYTFNVFDRVFKLIVNNVSVGDVVSIYDKLFFPREISFDLGNERVAYTLQKDNNLLWIKDWILLLNKFHSISNFIIYDNNSKNYSIEELTIFLNFSNINIYIVPVDYLYGPGAHEVDGVVSNWDSDFLQYAMFEHMRYAFFNGKGYVLNLDIDEINFNNDLFHLLIVSNRPAISFSGHWAYIPRVKSSVFSDSNIVRHSDHTLLNKKTKCALKWIANLSMINSDAFLGVHSIINQPHVICIEQFYVHFMGITNNWKYKRGCFAEFGDDFSLLEAHF
jgi:hypothetical protein